jgi:hypothetical protein
MRRRGQAEVVGLLVIVIILIFLGFIYLRFSISGGNDGYQSVRQSVEAQSMLQALLLYDVKEWHFKGMVSSCYYDSSTCSGLDQLLQDIFGVILKEGQDYHLVLWGEEAVFYESGVCERGIVSRIPFTFDRVFFEGSLVVC